MKTITKTSKKIRVKCVNATWNEGIKDPELTTGKFYELIDDNVIVMNKESMFSLIGDSGEEITRPKFVFYVYL